MLKTARKSQSKRIAICGSMSFQRDMETLAHELSTLGYQPNTPVPEEEDLNWDELPTAKAIALKKEFLSGYFETIRESDLVLIANFRKHGIDGYIGANTLMEGACGCALGKPVYLLFAPGHQSCRLEALAIASGVLEGDLSGLPPLDAIV